MNFLLTILFLLFVAIIGILPFWCLYRFSDFMYFMLRLSGYRKKVIVSNLKKAYPNMDEKSINKLVKKIYRNLTDILIEGIKGLTISKKQINKRHRILNPEILNTPEFAGRSVLAVAAHYGNWEWGSMSASLQTDLKAIALYKPLSNKYIDKLLMNGARKRSGTEMLSIFETSAGFERFKSERCVYLMAADQSPSRSQSKNSYWVDFMGIKTAFLHGPEKYARKYNYPIIYVDIQRRKRGYYEIELIPLVTQPNKYKEGEITRKFAQTLEGKIKEKPQDWLWSHRRWKLTPD